MEDVMATDGSAFSRWLRDARIAVRALTPKQIAVLEGGYHFLEECAQDYYSRRALEHFLLHAGTGLKVAQIARLVGVSRPTASEHQRLSTKQVVQATHHRMAGRPHGKLLPRYAGPIAQFLVTHAKASRLDILGFIEKTWQVRVSRIALWHFMKKYGLDVAERALLTASENPPAVEVGTTASDGPPQGAVPTPSQEFFLPPRTTRGHSFSSRQP
jgi:hypothetical protein